MSAKAADLTYEVHDWTDGPISIPAPQTEAERAWVRDIIETTEQIGSQEAEGSDLLVALRSFGQALRAVEWHVPANFAQLYECLLEEMCYLTDLTKENGEDATKYNLPALYVAALKGESYDPEVMAEARERLDAMHVRVGRLLDTADAQLREFWEARNASQNGGQS